MTEHWHKLSEDSESAQFEDQFWNKQSEDLARGEFWADRISRQHSEPVKRLRTAIDNLPLPAAFREAAIATRALIRQHRKEKSCYEDELCLLYWLAAVNSLSETYSEKLGEPGFNIMQSIPGKVVKRLSFSYAELGYEKLGLLTRTDTKWLVAEWGEPRKHRTLNDLHRAVWEEYESKVIARREGDQKRLIAELRELSASTPITKLGPNTGSTHVPAGKGRKTSMIVAFIVLFSVAMVALNVVS
jgi:hypothetical protein